MARGARVRPRTRGELRGQAEFLRSALGFEEPYLPIAEFLDVDLPQLMPGFVLQVVENDVLGEQEGVTIPDHKKIILPERVYLGAIDGRGRDRFTCAHELGHLLLHGGVQHARVAAETEIFRRPLHSKVEDAEWQADNFAAEILMPVSAALVCSTNGAKLAHMCGVSIKAATNRLMILKMDRVIK